MSVWRNLIAILSMRSFIFAKKKIPLCPTTQDTDLHRLCIYIFMTSQANEVDKSSVKAHHCLPHCSLRYLHWFYFCNIHIADVASSPPNAASLFICGVFKCSVTPHTQWDYESEIALSEVLGGVSRCGVVLFGVTQVVWELCHAVPSRMFSRAVAHSALSI